MVENDEKEFTKLLEDQNDFITNFGTRSTVRLVRMNKLNQKDELNEKDTHVQAPSLFRLRQAKGKKTMYDELHQANIEPIPDVIGEIIEKNLNPVLDSISSLSISTIIDIPETGFPKPIKRTIDTIQSKKINETTLNSRLKHSSIREHISHLNNHSDNDRRIASMSISEIIEAQREIESYLGKDLVDIIKKRQSDKDITHSNHIEPQNPKLTITLNFKDKENVTHPPLQLDQYEVDKLCWTSPVSDNIELFKRNRTDSSNITLLDFKLLRFDFNGNILNRHPNELKTNDYSDTDLFHHGDHPEVPGYSMSEIVNYWLASVNGGQRHIALRTLSYIMLRGRFIEKLYLSPTIEDDKINPLLSLNRTREFNFFAGFGKSLRNWERYVYETEELHWRGLLSCRSSNLSVQIGGLQLLTAILFPDQSHMLVHTLLYRNLYKQFLIETSYGMNGLLLLFSLLQLPTTRRLSLGQWPTAYRRIVMGEHLHTIQSYFTTTNSSQLILDLDETISRLTKWYNDTPHNDAPTSPLLSVFDPIVHLLLSGNDLRSNYDQDQYLWPSEIGTFIGTAFQRYFSDPSIQILILQFCIGMSLHSKEITTNILLGHSELCDELEMIALSLTVGTELYQKRISTRLSTQCVFTDNEIRLRTIFIHYLRILSETGGKEATRQILSWGDGMIIIVLLRQIMFEEYKTNSETIDTLTTDIISVSVNNQSNIDQSYKHDIDHELNHYLKNVDVIVPNTPTVASRAIQRLILQQESKLAALELLSYWELQHLWSEDIQGYYQLFMLWTTKCYKTHRSLIDHVDVSTLLHIKLLVSLTKYLWCSLLKQPVEHNFIVIPLIERLSQFLKLDTSYTCFHYHLKIEMMNLLQIAATSLNVSWKTIQVPQKCTTQQQHKLSESDETLQFTRCQQLCYFTSLFEKAYSSSIDILVTRDDCNSVLNKTTLFDSLKLRLQETTQWEHDILLVSRELGLISDYFQFPFYYKTDLIDSVFDGFIDLRLLIGQCQVELSMTQLIKHSKYPEQCDHFKHHLSGTSTDLIDILLLLFQFLKRFFHLIDNSINYTGSTDLCGDTGIWRIFPFGIVFHDCIHSIIHVLESRQACHNINWLDHLTILLATPTTSDQADEAFTFFFNRLITQIDTIKPHSWKQLTHNICGLAKGLLLPYQTIQSDHNEPVLLASNVLSCWFQLIPILSQHNNTTNSNCSLYENLQLVYNQSLFSFSSNSLFDQSITLRSVSHLIELLCKTYANKHIQSPSFIEGHILERWDHIVLAFKQHLVESNTHDNNQHSHRQLLDIRLERGLDQLLATYKWTVAPSILMSKLVWLFALKPIPVNCRKLLWADTVTLQLLFQSDVSLLSFPIEKEDDLDIAQYQKDFFSHFKK